MSTRRGSIRSADRLLTPAVAETLRSLPKGDDALLDSAARRLATEYAVAIDDAAIVRDLALAAMEQISAGDAFVEKAYQAVLRDLEHRRILSDLGPKLLASLSELGATAAARAKGGRQRAPAAPTVRTALERAREAHGG